MFLVSHLPITPSKRNSSTIQEWYLRTSKLRKLSVGFKSKTGRGASGRIVLFSKGSRCAKKVHRLMHCSFSGMFAASVIYEFQKNPLKNSTLALLCNSMGCWFYTPHISNMLQLGYTKLATAHIGIDFFGWKWPTSLKYFTLYTRVCWLAQVPSKPIKYLKAAGVSGLVLSVKFLKKWAVVLMPSGSIKLFWNRNYGYGGWVMHESGGLSYWNKAGVSVNRGIKSRVRGTVKNANDHPNGGRNRSLLCSKTPWGYNAKKSRFPATKTKTKTLAKRLLDTAKN